jgi:hypothetical protein
VTINADKYAKLFRYIFLALVYVIVCLVVLDTFMDVNGFRGDSERFGFNRMMTYSAERPFAYRILTPIIVNAVVAVIPQSVISSLDKDLLKDSRLLKYVAVTENWDAESSARYHITYFYLFLCLVVTVIALRKLTKLVYDFPAPVTDFAPALAMLLLPMTFVHGGYMYDFPELMFLVMLLVFMLQSRWRLYYLLFPLSLLNKETGILTILLFAALKYKAMPKATFWRHIAAQVLIGVPILVVIRLLFADNPEPTGHLRILTNLGFWINPLSYFKFAEIYAPLLGVPRGGNVITLFLIAFALAYRWREKPMQIRRLFWLPAIVVLPLFLFWGNRDEIRVLAPLFPSIYLLGLHTLYRLYDSFVQSGRATSG